MTESAEHGEDGDHGETSTGEANAAASTHQNALLEGLTSLTKELKDFKQDMRRDLGEFKNEIKKAVKDDFAEFKEEFCKSNRSKTLLLLGTNPDSQPGISQLRDERHAVDGGEAEHGDARQNCRFGEPFKMK